VSEGGAFAVIDADTFWTSLDDEIKEFLDDEYFEQLGVANAILNWKKVVAKYKQKRLPRYM
jgi:predicted house-cleaning noncanonical NTP pyrophosphatase (MazG superfamily)